jgi:lysophospholipase L1-like esterase
MANDNINKNNRVTQIGIGIILLANVLLFFVLFNLRFQRIYQTEIPFYNVSFIAILAVTVAFALFLSAISLSGRLKPILDNHNRLWVWLVLSAIALLLLNFIVSAFEAYFAAYLIWLLLADIGLLVIAFSERLTKVSIAEISRNGFAIIVSIVFTIILLEVSLRIYFGTVGSEADRVAYIYSADEILQKTNRFIGLPYINYGLTKKHPEHNSRGYRGLEFETPKPEDTYRIFALGGSTTYGDSLQTQEAYPAQLQAILQNDYSYTNIEVVNAGVNAYSSYDSLANLTYHVLDDEPDMIIVYHGVNDVRARLVDPESYSGLNLQRGIWSSAAVDIRFGGSTLWRFLRIQLGIIRNPTNFETFLSTSSDVVRCPFSLDSYCEPLQQEAQAVLDANPPIYFERNFRNMVAIAKANGADVVFSTWAYYTGETPFDNFMSPQHMQNGVDEQNEIVRSLGEELDIPVVDFAETVPENAAFWIDGMHLTPEGTYEQASEYAAFLIENELLPKPPEE